MLLGLIVCIQSDQLLPGSCHQCFLTDCISSSYLLSLTLTSSRHFPIMSTSSAYASRLVLVSVSSFRNIAPPDELTSSLAIHIMQAYTCEQRSLRKGIYNEEIIPANKKPLNYRNGLPVFRKHLRDRASIFEKKISKLNSF